MNMPHINRILAIILRYTYLESRNINRLFQIILWPMIDIMILGFITVWIQQDATGLASKAMIPVIGALFWQVVVRSQQEFSMNLIEEFSSKNLVNIFSSPCSFSDWLCAGAIFSLMRMLAVFILGSLLIWSLYDCSVLIFGWWLAPLVLLFVLSGWFLGFSTASIIISGGQKMAAFTWATWIITPFCGAFNPVEVLPHWMQFISKLLPLTYTFRAIQEYIATGIMPVHLIITSLIMNLVCLALAFILLITMFKKAKHDGLSRLEID